MNEQRAIELSHKIPPQVLIANKIELLTRNIKYYKLPPFKSKDCKAIFYRFKTDDDSEGKILEDYNELICCDVITLYSEELKLGFDCNNQDIIMTKKDSYIKGKRFIIFSTERLSVNQKVILKNHSHTHKKQKYDLKKLTICSLKEADSNIFKMNEFQNYQQKKISRLNITQK